MTSQPFAISSQTHMRSIAAAWLSARLWWMLLPVAVICAAAFYDVRFVYVLVIVGLIVYPMALCIVWINYAFSPATRRAIAKKRVTVMPDGLLVEFIPLSEEYKAMTPYEIHWTDVHKAANTSDGIVLILGKRLDQRMFLPQEYFSRQAWDAISDKVGCNLPAGDL